MNEQNTGIDAIGNSLIEHVRDATASRQGLIDELFPYIWQASRKISARAVERFLEETHKVKISYVTIGRALRNPAKSWNAYADLNGIEEAMRIVSQTHDKPISHFMSEPEKYTEMLDGKKVYVVDDSDDDYRGIRATVDYDNAVAQLDAKWFCFDEETLEAARFYLLKRFMEEKAPITQSND